MNADELTAEIAEDGLNTVYLSRAIPHSADFRRLRPHYSMKVQFRGRRMAFTLGTANKETAARRAAAIAQGIEAIISQTSGTDAARCHQRDHR